jgi:hypothetical protein
LSKLSIHDVTALTDMADGYVPSNHVEQEYQKLKALADLAVNKAQAAYWNTKGVNVSHAFIVVALPNDCWLQLFVEGLAAQVAHHSTTRVHPGDPEGKKPGVFWTTPLPTYTLNRGTPTIKYPIPASHKFCMVFDAAGGDGAPSEIVDMAKTMACHTKTLFRAEQRDGSSCGYRTALFCDDIERHYSSNSMNWFDYNSPQHGSLYSLPKLVILQFLAVTVAQVNVCGSGGHQRAFAKSAKQRANLVN